MAETIPRSFQGGHGRAADRSNGPDQDSYFRVVSARKFELAFPGHALEGFARTFDAVLVVGSVVGKQSHDLIGAVGNHVADRARREVDGLTNLKLVFFQRGSPELHRHGRAPPLEKRLPPISAAI